MRSPWAAKWLLKVDDEMLGCGHAYFSTLAIKGAAEVLERCVCACVWACGWCSRMMVVVMVVMIRPKTNPQGRGGGGRAAQHRCCSNVP